MARVCHSNTPFRFTMGTLRPVPLRWLLRTMAFSDPNSTCTLCWSHSCDTDISESEILGNILTSPRVKLSVLPS